MSDVLVQQYGTSYDIVRLQIYYHDWESNFILSTFLYNGNARFTQWPRVEHTCVLYVPVPYCSSIVNSVRELDAAEALCLVVSGRFDRNWGDEAIISKEYVNLEQVSSRYVREQQVNLREISIDRIRHRVMVYLVSSVQIKSLNYDKT